MSAISKPATTAVTLPASPATMLPALAEICNALSIPREVLASDDEIAHAWQNLPRELNNIPAPLRTELLARMCVAVSAGLFDGAINYVWNAAILNLRAKTRHFGLDVVAQILQKDFEEKHLVELQDSQLLELCLKLNLLNEDGYFLLDQSRDVRNNFSAAHPTLGKINDAEFLVFLNRCVKYALGESSSPKGVDMGAFIAAVKGARFNEGQRKHWEGTLRGTHAAQRQVLIGMAHGIYCDPSMQEPARLNALDVCISLHDTLTAATKSDLLNRHSDYLAKGDEQRRAASQQFFEKLGLLTLLNHVEQHSIVMRAIDRLRNVHQSFNNFHNEPPFAERLLELSMQIQVPDSAKDAYVFTVVACYIGNGYGVSWSAEPPYEKMIRAFSPKEVATMIMAPSLDPTIGGRVKRLKICADRLKQALKLVDPATVPNAVKRDYDSMVK